MWRHLVGVELDIVFHTTSPASHFLCESGSGSVINTASYSGLRGVGPLGAAAHAAAKRGVVSMTKQLATEGAEHGVCEVDFAGVGVLARHRHGGPPEGKPRSSPST